MALRMRNEALLDEPLVASIAGAVVVGDPLVGCNDEREAAWMVARRATIGGATVDGVRLV